MDRGAGDRAGNRQIPSSIPPLPTNDRFYADPPLLQSMDNNVTPTSLRGVRSAAMMYAKHLEVSKVQTDPN